MERIFKQEDYEKIKCLLTQTYFLIIGSKLIHIVKLLRWNLWEDLSPLFIFRQYKFLIKTDWQMTKTKTTNFLNKLFNLLEATSGNGHETKGKETIEWNEEGNGFVVYDSKRLCQDLLPQFFKHAKLTSFIRQLNMYNFQKVYKGNCQFAYSHKFFTKNQINNFKKIKRKKESSKVFYPPQSDSSSDEYEQYVSLQKRQIKLQKACLISIKRTQLFLNEVQENRAIVLQDQQKAREQFLKKVSELLEENGISTLSSNALKSSQPLKESLVTSYEQLVLIDKQEMVPKASINHIKALSNIQIESDWNNASSDIMERLLQAEPSTINHHQLCLYN